MPAISKPIDYLICEGPTDSYFVSLYLERKLGYLYNPEAANKYKKIRKNCTIIYLNGKTRDVLIYGAGGSSNISELINSIVLTAAKNVNQSFRIAVIVDRDTKNDKECYSLVKNDEISFQINKWSDGSINSLFLLAGSDEYEKIPYLSFFSVIPETGNGAFENVLMEAILDKEPSIHSETITFYDSLSTDAKKYINKNRLVLKAKLNTMLLLIDPENTFSSLQSKYQLIDLDDENIKRNFGFLNNFIDDIDIKRSH